MVNSRAIDESHPAFRGFLRCIARGASLQDIYDASGDGFARARRAANSAPESVLRHARIEFSRVFEHDRDLAEPLDRAFGLSGKRVLEFGCGTGALATAMVGRGARVVGVDPTAASLEAARLRAAYFDKAAGFDAVLVDTTPGLPLRPASFDMVVTNSVLEFIPSDRETYIVDLISLLKPGGLLVISTENGLFPQDYYTGQLLPLLRRKAARRRNWPYGLTWFELRRWARQSPALVSDLSVENRFNSIDKLAERTSAAGNQTIGAALTIANRLYKNACSWIGVPSGLLFPYTTFILRVDAASDNASRAA